MTHVLRLQHTSVPIPVGGENAARSFYGDALGMNEISRPSSLADLQLVWFQAGDDGHELHCFVDESMSHQSVAQHLCLQVDDIDGYRQRIEERDIEIEETTPIHNRPRFFVRDPFGNLIELTQITGNYT